MLSLLRAAARHARLLLVAGLVTAVAFPGLAQVMVPALPALVAWLVFVSALRIGARDALGSLADARRSLWVVLALQLAVPLAGLGLLWLSGWQATAAALAILMALAGSPISGAPAITAMLGHDPAPAMRLLVLGTALLPLTVLPVFWLSPALDDFSTVVLAALRLSAVIACATAAAFALRRLLFPRPAAATIQAIDGLSALSLAVIVVGLMSAIGPTLRADPASLVGWLALAFAVNIGQQLGARALGAGAATCVVAGNRNIALFLVALPVSITEPLLLFIGCYQIPMYLTPILMHRLYARG